MKTDYIMTALKRPADEQLAEVKQALIEKGVATENTPNSELDEAIKNITPLSEFLSKRECEKLFYQQSFETIDKIIKFNDTSKVTNMSNMFYQCSKLITIPELDTSNVTSMGSMFQGCSKLITIPLLNTSNVTSMNYMFQGCSNFTTMPQLDTSKVTSMGSMFSNCTSLETIPELNLIRVTSNNNMLYGCSKLTNLKLKNIKTSLQIGSGTSWGHLLTLESLIGVCKECRKQSSSMKITMGSANLEKIANVYVKFTDTTQTTIATGEKGDVVVCEITDEGAMTITEYMTLKNWTLA